MLADIPTTYVCSSPYVVDGDTIYCAGKRIRLFGIDAPEIAHPEYGKFEDESDGQKAKWSLIDVTRRVRVRCVQQDTDRYRRPVAICSADRVGDLSRFMLRAKLVCEWVRYDRGYYAGVGRVCIGKKYGPVQVGVRDRQGRAWAGPGYRRPEQDGSRGLATLRYRDSRVHVPLLPPGDLVRQNGEG